MALLHLIAATALAVLSVGPSQSQAPAPPRQDPAASPAKPEAPIFNGATLYRFCAPVHAADSANGKACRAYILGAIDAFRHLQFIEQRGAFCFRTVMAGRDVTAPFVEHLHQRREIHDQPAARILRDFLIGRFPCEEAATGD